MQRGVGPALARPRLLVEALALPPPMGLPTPDPSPPPRLLPVEQRSRFLQEETVVLLRLTEDVEQRQGTSNPVHKRALVLYCSFLYQAFHSMCPCFFRD